MIWRATALACVLGGPAAAGWSCEMIQEKCLTACESASVTFHVDPNQFVAPQNANEPPRRQVTRVTMNNAVFVAEAILMQGGAEGFYEDAGELGRRLMIVQPNGDARLTLQPRNITLTGQCSPVDGP